MNKLKYLEIKYNHQVSNIFLWNYKTAFRWRWIEFSNFKAYEYWDDSKDIDWLVSAREWKVLIKQFQEDRELQVLFVFDITSSMNFWLKQRKIDTLINTFYLLWLSTLNSWWSIWWMFLWKDKETLNFWKWKSSIIRLLNKIDFFLEKNYENDDEIDLSDVLKNKNKLIFIFTDKIQVNEKHFRICSLKNDVIYINIFDSFENTLSWANWLAWLSDTSINLDDDLKKNKYIDLRSKKIIKFKSKINMLWWSYLFIDESTNIYKRLLKLMKERQR